MTRRATPLRPEGAPRLGETYRDWRDFTDRVARPWVENDGDDARVDNWYRTLMAEAEPYYLAVSLVIADNRIKALEAELEADNRHLRAEVARLRSVLVEIGHKCPESWIADRVARTLAEGREMTDD